jgi:hypothetical protein
MEIRVGRFRRDPSSFRSINLIQKSNEGGSSFGTTKIWTTPKAISQHAMTASSTTIIWWRNSYRDCSSSEIGCLRLSCVLRLPRSQRRRSFMQQKFRTLELDGWIGTGSSCLMVERQVSARCTRCQRMRTRRWAHKPRPGPLFARERTSAASWCHVWDGPEAETRPSTRQSFLRVVLMQLFRPRVPIPLASSRPHEHAVVGEADGPDNLVSRFAF